MIACYDLARCPPTYDVVAFLAHAELERVRRREEHLEIHILPGTGPGGFRRDSLWPRTVEERQQMRDRVLVPLCRLLPSVRTVSVDADRSAEGWGKGEYYISLPAIVRALKQGCRPLRFLLDGQPPKERAPRTITFTLREAEHHSIRNSRVAEWIAAGFQLCDRGWQVVIIRDAAKMDEPLPYPDNVRSLRGVFADQFGAASWLSMRAQYYASAALNVGISNGPMWMSIFMDAPTLMLRPTTNEARGCYDDRFYARWGVPRGAQLPGSPPHQRLAWCEDYAEDIVREVTEMLEVVA